MKVRVRVVLVAFCAVLVTGCAGGLLGESPAPKADTVRIISMGYAKSCRLVGPVDATSAYPQDQDLYAAAMVNLRIKATEMSGNAAVVRSYQVQSGAGTSHATLKADIYVCPAAKEEEK